MISLYLYAIDLNYIVIREIMKSTSIVAVWVTSIALLLTLVGVTVPLAHAQMTLDITKAGGDSPTEEKSREHCLLFQKSIQFG